MVDKREACVLKSDRGGFDVVRSGSDLEGARDGELCDRETDRERERAFGTQHRQPNGLVLANSLPPRYPAVPPKVLRLTTIVDPEFGLLDRGGGCLGARYPDITPRLADGTYTYG